MAGRSCVRWLVVLGWLTILFSAWGAAAGEEKPSIALEHLDSAAFLPDGLNGAWSGEWAVQSYRGENFRGKIEFFLQQDGKRVSGRYTFHGGVAGLTDVPLIGTRTGNTLELSIPSIPNGRIQATVDTKMIQGFYVGKTGIQTRFAVRRVAN